VLAQELVELKSKRAPASDGDSAKRAFEAGIMVSLARMLSQFKEEHVDRIRQSVDSPTQLAKLRRSCGGRLEELEKSVRHDGKGL
jgi:GTP1/Obg family GTP-binding protein